MHIKIKNKLITEPIVDILYTVKRELTNGKLSKIASPKQGNVLISCPVHKGGKEQHPSCMVLTDTHCTDLEAGFAHCFTCGYDAPFAQVIADLFDADKSFGEEWLVERFGNTLIQQEEYLPEIILDKEKSKSKFLSEDVLIPFDFYHPYMWQRKLTRDVVDRFRIGYDKERDAITFPVYDEKHRLVMVTARSVNTKRFYIPQGVAKPVYLLYDIIERGIDSIVITEGQIDALTSWTYGKPAVATMGCPSDKQIDALNRSGIRCITAMFDNDAAGFRFYERLRKKLNPDILLCRAQLPSGKKDINELTLDEFNYSLNNVI